MTMKRLISGLRNKKVLMCVVALLLVATSAMSLAYYTDRIAHEMKFTTGTFSKDDYEITTKAPVGPFIAGEDVVSYIYETNKRTDDFSSTISMTAEWISPDPNSKIFGNDSASDNATLTVSGDGLTGTVALNYKVISGDKISFEIPSHILAGGAKNKELTLTLHIPETLYSTGEIKYTHEKITLQQHPTGFSDEFDPDAALDYGVRVGWAASSIADKNGKALMGFLAEGSKAGEYVINFEFAFGYKTSPMKDFSSRTAAKWSHYKNSVTALNFIEKMTTIGDYAFPDFSKVTSITLPSTITSVGTSAFDNSGLTGELVIPKAVAEIESLAFGNLPKVNEITFEHTANTLTLPANKTAAYTNKGAFYVPNHVNTTVNSTVAEIMYEYGWHDGWDNRRHIPMLDSQDYWQRDYFEDYYWTVIPDASTITTINIVDYYMPDNTESYVWDGSARDENSVGTVTVYLSGDEKTLTIAGNGYGLIYANNDSTYAFAGMSSLVTVNGADILDTRHVETMEGMFAYSPSLTTVDGISTWNTNNVITTAYMFRDCPSLEEIDLHTHEEQALDGSGTYKAWDTPKLENISYMFSMYGSDWDKAAELSSINVTGWTVTNVTNGSGFIQLCHSLEEIQGISSWTPTDLEEADYMFYYLPSLTSLDLTGWEGISNLTNTRAMFYNCASVEEIDISTWDMSAVTSTRDMFALCSSLKKLTIPSTLTNFGREFAAECTSLTEITFLHDADTQLEFPDEGESYGAFFVDTPYSKTNPLRTKVITSNSDVLAYDWKTDHRGYTITVNTVTGGTMTATPNVAINGKEITLKPTPEADCYPYQGSTLSYLENGVTTTVELDSTTLSFKMPTSDVTITPHFGEVIPMLAANSSWFTNDYGITRSSITKINIVDTYTPSGTAGTDYYAWDASAAKDGSVMAYVEGTELTIAGNGYGLIYANPDSMVAFSDKNLSDLFSNLTTINGGNVLDTSKVTNMGSMFRQAYKLTSVDVSEWNTGNVTSMQAMFYRAKSLETVDVSNWDTGNVTNMSFVFSGTDAEHMKIKSLDVSGWNTENVTTMQQMFYCCSSLENLDVSGWNTGNVTTMNAMFNCCYKLKYLDVSDWNTSKVTSMRMMFQCCYALDNLDVATKTINEGTDNEYTAWNVSNVQSFEYWFNHGTSGNNNSITQLDVSNWNPSAATNMAFMFAGCDDLTELDMSNWTVSKVTTMGHMFADCFNMTSYNFSGWNTASLTNMDAMFNDNRALTSIDVSDFDTGKVTLLRQLFEGCQKLTSIVGLDKWDTGMNTDFQETFARCSSLTELNLSSWNTSSVKYMYLMFSGCSNLKTIYVSDKWSTASLSNGSYTDGSGGHNDQIFNGCSKLVGGNGTAWASNHVDYTTSPDDRAYAQIDGKNGKVGYLTNNIFLSYSDLLIGETGNAKLTIKSKVHTASDSAVYEIISGGEYIDLIDSTTGQVKGKAEGTATVKVTLTATNGDTITAQGTVKVAKSIPMLAANSSWFTNSYGITRSSITKINIVDSYTPSGTAGTDYYAWDASAAKDKSVMAYVEGTELTIAGNGYGKIFANPDSSNAFAYSTASQAFVNTTAINGLGMLDTSRVTTMQAMFRYLPKVTTLDVGDWDVSNVTSLYTTFSGSEAYPMGISTLDVSKWNTKNVSTMVATFQYCTNITSLDVSNWDTSSCTSLQNTFAYCYKLSELNLSKWNTVNVTAMNSMFTGCSSLSAVDVAAKTVGSGDSAYVSWNVSNVKKMNHMFNNCSKLDVLDVSKWNTVNVTNMKAMFQNCSSLSELDVSNWNTGNVTDMSYMFNKCTSLTELDVSKWNTGKVTTFATMFQGNDHAGDMKFTKLDVSNWNTSSATNMSHMFYGCAQLTEMDLSKWVVSKVTTMSHMFADCFNMTSYNFSGWNTASLTNITAMFNDNRALTSVDVSDFDTGEVTNMAQTFESCTNLRTISGLENWDTSKNTTFQETFARSSNLTELDLSAWNTSSVKYLYHMFSDCSNLETIYVSDKWSTVSLGNGTFDNYDGKPGVNEKIFYRCNKLVGGNGTAWATNHVDYDTAPDDRAYAQIDGKDGKVGYLTDINGTGTVSVMADIPDPELPEGVTAGKQQKISAMPDVAQINAQAEAAAPENTKLYGWLVDSGFAKVLVSLEDFEATLASVYEEDSDYELSITPLYEAVQEAEEPEATVPAETEATEPSEPSEPDTEPTEAPSEPSVEATEAATKKPADPTLPDGVSAGITEIIIAMPDVSNLNEQATAKAPENSSLYGWLVDNGSEKQIALLADFEEVLQNIYNKAPDMEIGITPLYQAVAKARNTETEPTEPAATEPAATEEPTEPAPKATEPVATEAAETEPPATEAPTEAPTEPSDASDAKDSTEPTVES